MWTNVRNRLSKRLYKISQLLLILFIASSCQAADDQGFPRDEFPKTDFSRSVIDLNEIMSGGPPKDGIPAIDNPRFISVEEARQWLHPNEPVIVVEKGKTMKAYPLQILMYHEIVNDELAGQPLSVTFCPLCNASIVFSRSLGDKMLDFGTTGRLRKSDLVMYDRQTQTWWQQFSGRAIVGELSGQILQRIPSAMIAFGEVAEAHPRAEVLSRETGYRRPYGRNPYRGYDRIGQNPFLFRDPVDQRLPAMERVLNVSIGTTHKLYPFSVIKTSPVINDRVAGIDIVVFAKSNTFSALDKGLITDSRLIPSAIAYDRRVQGKLLSFEAVDDGFRDQETGSTWNLLGQATAGSLQGSQLSPVEGGVHFAFAWLAFNPDSIIYQR